MKIFLLYFILFALLLSMESQILAQSPDQLNATNNQPEAPPPAPKLHIPGMNNREQVSDTKDKTLVTNDQGLSNTSGKQVPLIKTSLNVNDTDSGASSNTTRKAVNDVNYRIEAPIGLAQNGALLRGFYVLLSFSILTLAYFVGKSYR